MTAGTVENPTTANIVITGENTDAKVNVSVPADATVNIYGDGNATIKGAITATGNANISGAKVEGTITANSGATVTLSNTNVTSTTGAAVTVSGGTLVLGKGTYTGKEGEGAFAFTDLASITLESGLAFFHNGQKVGLAQRQSSGVKGRRTNAQVSKSQYDSYTVCDANHTVHTYGANGKCTVCDAEPKKFYGKVTKDGEPAEGIEVVAKSKTNDVEYSATTGSDGKYTMNIFQDGLEYTLSLKNTRGYEGTTSKDGNFSSSCDFSLTRHKVSVKIGEHQYTTFYDGVYDMIIPEGFKAWTATVQGEEITYSELSQYIPAGTGVLLYYGDITDTNILSATDEVENNVTDNVFFGYDADTTPTSSVFKYYKLQYSEEQNRVGFYWGAENGAPFLCKAHKAYIGISGSMPVKKFTNLPMDDDDVTAIGLTPTYSDREGAAYNLSGQKVSENYKGIVIKNGKKVMQ